MTMDPYYKKLQGKMMASILFFSLVPLLVLAGTIYYQFSVAYTNKTLQTLRTLARNRCRTVEMFLQERAAQVVTVTRTHSIEQLEDQTYLSNVFNVMQSTSKFFIDIEVMDEHGKNLAYVGPYRNEIKYSDCLDENWFRLVLASGFYISDVCLGFREVPHFTIAVVNNNGHRPWVLRTAISSESIDDIIRQGQCGLRGDAFIINRNNVLQTPSRLSGSLMGHPRAPDFSSSVGTAIREIEFEGAPTLFATSQMINPRWVVVIKQEPGEELQPLFMARYVGLSILTIAIFLIASGAVLITQFITRELVRMERKNAEKQDILIQSAKMAALGKMAAGIAHEINNPLAIMAEQAGWMKDLLNEEDVTQIRNFQEIEGCIGKIQRNIERSGNIVHHLLRFGRRMEPTMETFDVNQTVMETVSFLEDEAKFREIKIETDYDETLPKITTDPAQLQQVFLNLINNAIDAIAKGGLIAIKTSYHKEDNEISVEIKDDGVGIPKEVIGNIFDPFFTTKTEQGRPGLGLSVSYSIMEKLGGRITAKSKTSEGSKFTVWIPAI